MDYLLTIILTIFSVYGQANAVTDLKMKEALDWLIFKSYKKIGVWVSVVFGIWACCCLWKTKSDAQRQHNEDVKRINELQHSLDHVSEQNARQSAMLAAQAATIDEQSRTIGSIAYNTRTTLEGKKRFVRCFRELTRLTKLNPDGTVFEGLICDDGVAIYWFRRDNRQMTGFHFFPNSELNRVLSGLPTDSLLFAADGSLNVDPQSELAIAFNESLFGKTPTAKGNPIEQERVLESIIEELELLLRYVYRAQSIRVEPSTTQDAVTRQKRFAGIAISFRYIVDPFADTLVERALPFPKFMFSEGFVQSLCGISKVEFSQRVIEKWRSMGVEPKIRMQDIHALNRICERKEDRRNSPFAKRSLEDE